MTIDDIPKIKQVIEWLKILKFKRVYLYSTKENKYVVNENKNYWRLKKNKPKYKKDMLFFKYYVGEEEKTETATFYNPSSQSFIHAADSVIKLDHSFTRKTSGTKFILEQTKEHGNYYFKTQFGTYVTNEHQFPEFKNYLRHGRETKLLLQVVTID